LAYIGRDTDKISNVEVLDNITFDGSSSYTLQKGGSNFTPSSANTLLVSIDGVVQAGNFTVSGSTIDFGTAVAGTSTCDFILHYGIGLITSVSDGTVTTAKLADSSVSLAKLTATGTKDSTTFLRGDNTFSEPVAGGITEADLWRLSADTSAGGYITSNWERADTDGQNHLGTGMSESSGVFTFPSTGYYLIMAMGDQKFTGGAHDQADFTIYSTTDGTNYARAAIANGSSATTNYHESTTTTLLFDVTNTSTHKLKFYSAGNWTLRGNTSQNQTHVTFVRLGDT